MRKNNPKGITLIEVVVAIGIFIICIEGFTLLFVKSWKNNKYVLEMGQSSLAVSQGVGKISEYIRKARQSDAGTYPIQSADDNDLIIFSDYDKDGETEKVHFYYSDGNVFMGTTNPSSGFPKTYASGDEQIQIIAGSIVNDPSTPIFYYFNKDYPGDQANNPISTPVSVADIRLIKVFLKTNIDPNNAPDNIEIQTFVEVRNLNDYDKIQ
ncbi:MAG: hypothetical protein COU40_00105 [Candidatus Moranbacteria bacterium CG10_big_fil_rev_8_21_14_0_10_35_21]|nr:MAG: hypothetical protein COU40_00105 [Candidatus Moranbacteria bacterium CG10_big_fil_rev_8_21_14_0_10_35_21]PJA88460.1 MAG: hypothetical protein CO139_03070 [Candidatus Moranbacteria bacterium CG_4_9_14_3_um_filter_36_9]